jgi:urate oxidase
MTGTNGGEKPGGRISLGHNDYGKSGIRLVRVLRDDERHRIVDLDVAVSLEGDFEAAHTAGDNSALLATDTMRNTVYALSKDHLTGSIEEFGLALVDHFLKEGPTVERARVSLTQFPWSRIQVDGRGHDHSFVRDAGERRAVVTGEGGDRNVEAGLGNLLIMKTTQSGWEDFFRDQFTTLPDTNDRILATVVTARWFYDGTTQGDYDRLWTGVRDQLLATFTDHYSPSMQNTLYRIGGAVLEAFPQVERIHLSFPNRHHLLYDLSRFGMENENEVFQATDEPYGLIEGTVEREA